MGEKYLDCILEEKPSFTTQGPWLKSKTQHHNLLTSPRSTAINPTSKSHAPAMTRLYKIQRSHWLVGLCVCIFSNVNACMEVYVFCECIRGKKKC